MEQNSDANGALVTLPDICRSFPEQPSPNIDRELFVKEIGKICEDGTICVVEGPDGIGKTTLLAQFAQANSQTTFSLFVSPTAIYGSNPDILRFDLCNQMCFFVNRIPLQSNVANEAILHSLISDLQKLAKKRPLYFVVDGLFDLPEADDMIRRAILQLLPTGLPHFRFVFSGQKDQVQSFLHPNIRDKVVSIRLVRMSQLEASNYLRDAISDADSLKEVYDTCQGIPGKLASVRRLLKSGTISRDELLSKLPDQLPQLFELEWRKVGSSDDLAILLLSIIALESRGFSSCELSEILNVEIQELRVLVETFSFLEEGKNVLFVSETFRQFAKKKLGYNRLVVVSTMIEWFTKKSEEPDTFNNLPAYLQEAGRLADVINFLSPERIESVLSYESSLSAIKTPAATGLTVSRQLDRDHDMLRFGILGAAITEAYTSQAWAAEIEARIALGEYDIAFGLAQSAILKEDRLQLLALIAKSKKEQGLAPDKELIDQIQHLCDDIDFSQLGLRTIQIACDLIYSLPSLAISLVERTNSAHLGENSLDWAFAILSISATSQERTDEDSKSLSDDLKAKIKDPEVLRFTSRMSAIVAKYSAAEVIGEAERLDQVGNRIYMLRHWASVNANRSDAAAVVEYALGLLIRTSEFSPNAATYRHLATPLKFISDRHTLIGLVNIFDSQKDTIVMNGPTDEYVRLQLLLAEAESKDALETARERVFEIYLYISEIDDLADKCLSLARLLNTLTIIDPATQFESRDKMHSMTETDLNNAVDEVLVATAEHYQALSKVIKVLARTRTDLALSYAQKLNIESRRDAALADLATCKGMDQDSKLYARDILDILSKIVDVEEQDRAILDVLKGLRPNKNGQVASAKDFIGLIDRGRRIRDAANRCTACCTSYRLLVRTRSENYDTLKSTLLKTISEAWDNVDIEWSKVDIGFNIAASLAEQAIEKARDFVSATENFRDQHELSSATVAKLYISCLRLAIRSFSGLVRAGMNTEDDLNRLTELMNVISSARYRVLLWSDLALACHRPQDRKLFDAIVHDKIKALLSGMMTDGSTDRHHAVVSASPSLYISHSNSAIGELMALPEDYRDSAISRIVSFYRRKHAENEPYETRPGHLFPLTVEEISDLFQIMDFCVSDSTAYFILESIADAMFANSLVKEKSSRFTSQQRAYVESRFESAVNTKFPNSRFITHEGYKIIAEAQLARIRCSQANVWSKLAERSRLIPNISDKSLVLSSIAVANVKADGSIRRAMLREAKGLVDMIPINLERADAYVALATKCEGIDKALAKECLTSAMSYACKNNGADMRTAQRRIIDVAQRVDPDLASSLASLSDSDPAREESKSMITQRALVHEIKKKMIGKNLPWADYGKSSAECAQAAWLMLGSLNSHRLTARHNNETRDYVDFASRIPISESYPILSFALENNIVRALGSNQAETVIRGAFEATCKGVEIAYRLTKKSKSDRTELQEFSYRNSTKSRCVIKAGERAKALEFLQSWVRENITDELVICDPYFGPNELDLIKLIQSVASECRIKIVTSRRDPQTRESNTAEAFRDKWAQMSVEDPIDTEIILVGTKSDQSLPVHDRWWICQNAGLCLGISYNGLGRKSDSYIEKLSQDRSEESRESFIDPYLSRSVKEHLGERLIYDSFTL